MVVPSIRIQIPSCIFLLRRWREDGDEDGEMKMEMKMEKMKMKMEKKKMEMERCIWR